MRILNDVLLVKLGQFAALAVSTVTSYITQKQTTTIYKRIRDDAVFLASCMCDNYYDCMAGEKTPEKNNAPFFRMYI